MSEAFEKNKRQVGKAFTYCSINTFFTVIFGMALFTLSRNQCYTIRTSEVPVDINLNPDANNVTLWFNMTCLLGFFCYGLGAVCSLGYLTNLGFLRSMSVFMEKSMRYVTYSVFVCVHVMRMSHTGKVCSGDYLPEDARSDEVVQNYMIATGRFFWLYIILGWILVPGLLILMVCIKGDKWASLALDTPK